MAPSKTWADETQAVRVGVDGDGGFSMAKASPQIVAFCFVEKVTHFETTRTKKKKQKNIDIENGSVNQLSMVAATRTVCYSYVS